MSVFTPTRKSTEQSKVHHSQYIRTETTPNEPGAKPAELVTTPEPETK